MRFWARLVLIVTATAVYGAVLAAWRSPRMAVYVAIKLPCVFVGSTLIVSAFWWVAGQLAGSTLRYREVLDAAVSAMAVAGSLFLSAAPVVLYFILSSAPDTGSRETLRFVHAALMSVHLLVFAGGGTAGVASLYRALKRRVPVACRLVPMMVAWVAAFGLVGCQLGWILRPLVGSPNISVAFLRADALASNFLESLFTQIIPHLIHQGALP